MTQAKMGVPEFMTKIVYSIGLKNDDITNVMKLVPKSEIRELRDFAKTANLKVNIAKDRESMKEVYLGNFDPVSAFKNLANLDSSDLLPDALAQFQKCGSQAAYLRFFLETLSNEEMDPKGKEVLKTLLESKPNRLSRARDMAKKDGLPAIITCIFSFMVNHGVKFGAFDWTQLLVWLSIPSCMLGYYVCTGFVVRGLLLANVGSIFNLAVQFHSGAALPGYIIQTVDIAVAIFACFLHKCEKKQVIQVLDKAFLLLNFAHEVQVCKMTNNMPVAPRFTFAEVAMFSHKTLYYFPYDKGCYANVKGENFKIPSSVYDKGSDFITCDLNMYLSKLEEESENGQATITVFDEKTPTKTCAVVKREYMAIARDFIAEVQKNGLGSLLKPFLDNFML